MNAAELRELGERLNCHATVYGENANAWANEIRQAAEVLELLAWAEEWDVDMQRDGSIWCAGVNGVPYSGKTLIDTLRRAREASNG